MSIYEYKSGTDKLELHASMARKNASFIGVNESGKVASMYIPNTDAPTVAAELLKAAGQESVIVPKAYEEVRTFGDSDIIECGGGPEEATARTYENPNWLYNKAANYVALAQWIEGAAAREAAEKAEAEAAEERLRERRNTLGQEYHALPYRRLGGGSQRLIDAHLELEDKLDGASRD